MIDLITWPRVVILISGIGMWFINFRRQRIGFIFFSIAAIGWAIHDFHIGEFEQMAVMIANIFTPILGWWKWGKIDAG